ncbi:AMP-binding protein, partial [Planctomycetota bacterium]
SGSTAFPKAIAHKLNAHFASAHASNSNLPLVASDRWLLTLPLCHVGGLAIVFRCIAAGATIVIDSRPSSLREQIASNSITHVSLVATQLKRLLKRHRGKLNTLKAVLLGGGAIPSQMVRDAIHNGIPLHTTYGLTEMASQVTTTHHLTKSDLPENDASASFHSGTALPSAEIRIADDGEILVRGDSLMEGYWRTGQIVSGDDIGLTPSGWFRTKDKGAFDTNGNLIVLGRIDNMFVSGGENIHPEEIESCLLELPNVQQAIVVSIPNTEFGARPVAFVDLGGSAIDESLLHNQLQTRLAKFKIPDRFVSWPIEANQTGIKPSRHELRTTAINHFAPRRFPTV